MIYRYTTCDSVIAKIMADSNMSEKDMRISDIREWIFEAVEKIGAPMQYIERESGEDGFPMIKLVDGQFPIPDDLVHLTALAYSKNPNGPWSPVRSETSTFKAKKGHCNLHYHPKQPMKYKPITTLAQVYGMNLCKAAQDAGVGDTEDVTYFIKPGWIVLNKRDGYVKIAYKSIAVDDRGYPLVPDTTSFQEAVYWYVMMKINFPKYVQGKLGGRGVNNAQNVYFYLQQQWNFYRNQAYAEAMMPTEGDMISIKNEWNKLIPEYESDETFFMHDGETQLINTDYYYGY